jgi:hypothetical protein
MSAKLPGRVRIKVDTYLEDNMQDLLWIADINYPNHASLRRVEAVGFPAFRFKLLSIDSKYAEFEEAARRVIAHIEAKGPAPVPGPADFQRALLDVFILYPDYLLIEKEHLLQSARELIFERFLPDAEKPHLHLKEFYAALDTPGFGNLRVVALERALVDRRLQELKFAHGMGKLTAKTGLVYMLSQGRENLIDLQNIDE